MNFDVNRPTTTAQLAALYLGNPNRTPQQVDSDLFLNSSQSRDYIHQQGKNLGIGDPAAYFGQMALAQRMASTPNGAQMEAARLAHMPPPDANLASLQTANRLKAYPLPAAGINPRLSPVMQADMAQQGITNPMEYLMAQRLGPNRGAVASVAGLKGPVNPDALYNEPTFQNAIGQNMGQSADVFQALTGNDLGQYHKQYQDAAGIERKRGIDFVAKALQEGQARPLQGGGLEWSERVFDPSTNRMVPTGKFTKGDAYQRSMSKYLPYVDKEIAEFQALEAAGGAPVAPLQMGTPPEQPVPEAFQTNHGWAGITRNFFEGSFANMENILKFQPTTRQSAVSRMSVPGRAAIHARPLLANNPRFQELARRDPAEARKIIMAIQQGQGSLNTSPMLNEDSTLYGP